MLVVDDLILMSVFVQETGDFELINYSEFGSIVDGILYSCDFSDKELLNESDSAQENGPIPLVLDDIIAMGEGRRARQAMGRLEIARKSLQDKRRAKQALEGALRLPVPVSAQDDALLAEELSKSEGLMTRTGLKRVSAESFILNPSVVSIPLSKARKIDTECSNHKKTGNKKDSESKTMVAGNLTSLTSKRDSKLTDNCPTSDHKLQNRNGEGSKHYNTKNSTPDSSSDYTVSATRTPCLCDKSTHSSDEGKGKRLEGTGVLSHGSQLRFGCLQFLLSIAGCPGHDELITCLLEAGGPAQLS